MVGNTDREITVDEYNRIKYLDPAMQLEALAKMRKSGQAVPLPDRYVERARELATAKPKPNKYGARAEQYDGYRFASQKEKRRYQELVILQHAGEISNLEVHPKFQFVVNDIPVSSFRPDFQYRDSDGAIVVEDVKSHHGKGSTAGEAYTIRKKLLRAIYGLEVKEIY